MEKVKKCFELNPMVVDILENLTKETGFDESSIINMAIRNYVGVKRDQDLEIEALRRMIFKSENLIKQLMKDIVEKEERIKELKSMVELLSEKTKSSK